MDDLTRAVAQFYASGWSAGGMNGGFNPPPAPDNSTLFVAPPSHEAGPSASDPNSHLFEEDRQRLERVREDNLRRLQENANLLKRAEAELRRLEDTFEIIKSRDAHRDEAARIKKKELLESEIEFIRTQWPEKFE
jgi:hypothetical protein